MSDSTSTPWHDEVCECLRESRALLDLGFRQDEVRWYGKGADHKSLLQLARKRGWHIEATDGESIGYSGVWFHFESCYPGHWAIHCEFGPRVLINPKLAKARVREIPAMLNLKRGMTELLLDEGRREKWEEQIGAHRRHARKIDFGDPSSLMVWTFDVGLDKDCTPREFVGAILPTIKAAAPTIDAICGCDDEVFAPPKGTLARLVSWFRTTIMPRFRPSS